MIVLYQIEGIYCHPTPVEYKCNIKGQHIITVLFFENSNIFTIIIYALNDNKKKENWNGCRSLSLKIEKSLSKS